jgi:hypothetical protein
MCDTSPVRTPARLCVSVLPPVFLSLSLCLSLSLLSPRTARHQHRGICRSHAFCLIGLGVRGSGLGFGFRIQTAQDSGLTAQGSGETSLGFGVIGVFGLRFKALNGSFFGFGVRVQNPLNPKSLTDLDSTDPRSAQPPCPLLTCRQPYPACLEFGVWSSGFGVRDLGLWFKKVSV